MIFFDAHAFLGSIKAANEALGETGGAAGLHGFDGIGLFDSIRMAGQLEALEASGAAIAGAQRRMSNLPLAIVRTPFEPA